MPSETLTYQAESPKAELLQQWLPPLLANLSLGRAQIAIDQIRTSLQDPSSGRIRLATVKSANKGVVAAAIAIQTAINDENAQPLGKSVDATSLCWGDTATIVHAGVTMRQTNGVQNSPLTADVIGKLANCLDLELAECGVSFVQWGADPVAKTDAETDTHSALSPDSVAHWCANFGFEPLATLDYMSGPVDLVTETSLVGQSDRSEPALSLTFEPFDWNDLAENWAAMERLVEQTYQGTLDCPQLCEFRSANQTMLGYRSSAAFAPKYWFTAMDPASGRPAGCLIVGLHGSPGSETDDPDADGAQPRPVVEIVYMGLVPEARSRGLAACLIAQAMRIARQIGGDRLILAVDQKNIPARRLYERAGLRSMMGEVVWCKRIAAADPGKGENE
ncbi:GNAT family N-acetyltransferase [Rubripirellula reticaptiva]|uniref:Mycothiol acetyltransferase n=1 Tax=Rubripirellula reticaptiva TaxID=2528013 RepID=A0A5C6EUB9_9BACT|nr:GNAT family N-acetyltransferase [Rubripirellula reticaptiva]TWU51206.1 Mycothiol acetyltransferase [Rubripirellula reticaptiva]